MPSVLIVDKSCNIKASVITKFSEEDLYKKAGFKSPNGFSKHSSWNLTILNETYVIELYGKITGRAGQENKYEFPPPADNILFFGTCLLVCKNKTTNAVVDITVEQWNAVYSELHGGFEDIDGTSSEDSRSEEKERKIPVTQRTKTGYVKDDFVVDDDSEVSSQTDTDEEFEQVIKKKPMRASKAQAQKKPPAAKRVRRKDTPQTQPSVTTITAEKETTTPLPTQVTVSSEQQTNNALLPENITSEDDNYLGCTKELCEEEYLPDP